MSVIDYLRGFKYYFINGFINRLPSRTLRNVLYKLLGLRLNGRVAIHLGVIFLGRFDNIKIGNNTVINTNALIDGRGGCEIGTNCSISRDVRILSMGHETESVTFKLKEGPVIVGSNVWIGLGAIVLPGVAIGDNVIIGAGSVVSKDIEANSVAVGNPCRVIKHRRLSSELSSVYFNPPFGYLS